MLPTINFFYFVSFSCIVTENYFCFCFSAKYFIKFPSNLNQPQPIKLLFENNQRSEISLQLGLGATDGNDILKHHRFNRPIQNFTYTTSFRTHSLCATSIKEGVALAVPTANGLRSFYECVQETLSCVPAVCLCARTARSYCIWA